MDYINNKIEKQLLSKENNFQHDVFSGLSKTPKTIPSKYLYDDRGSLLFQKIMTLPEYYLTRCEIEILETYKHQLASLFERNPFCIVELGAGDGEKTKILLKHFILRNMNFRYLPIDISASALNELGMTLRKECPLVDVQGIISDYVLGLQQATNNHPAPKLILFLGSNIGNFSPEEAQEFLCFLRRGLHPDDYLLIGFDLIKDPCLLTNAYNDPGGITAAFNRNILCRINRELNADFQPKRFKYFSTYSIYDQAVVSCLVSERDCDVYIAALDRSFHFRCWEPVHTESSYKFDIPLIQSWAMRSGFKVVAQLFDSRHYFVDSLWQAV